MSFNNAIKPPPGTYAVFFVTRLKPDAGENGYDEASRRMVELVKDQPGFIGAESARGEDGFGITISYWESEAHAKAWRANPEHGAVMARAHGWYDEYTTVRTSVT